jgi:hypothetical protein
MQRLTITMAESSIAMLTRAYALAGEYASLLSGHTTPFSVADAVQIVCECLTNCEREFTRGQRECEAYSDAQAFVPPRDTIARNREQLRRLGSLDAVIIEEKVRSSPQRFNLERWEELAQSSSQRELLREFATTGAEVCAPQPFGRAPPAPKQHNLERRLGDCYLKHLLKQHGQHAALVFDPADIPDHDRAQLSFIDLHWVPKPSPEDREGQPPRNPAGRLCGDPSNVSSGTSLNSDEALTLCRAKYPHCELPTIIKFLRQWHDHSVARGFPMREGLVWQEDVRNAFGQVTLSVDSAKRSCVSCK